METTYDCVILAAGNYPTHPVPLAILNAATHIICCDGAAEGLLAHGLMPHAIVGDGDSLSADMKARYTSIIHTVEEQEYNDLTKATRFAVEKFVPRNYQCSPPALQPQLRIAYLGCTGKREDHTMGNIALMAFYRRQFHILPTLYTDHGTFIPTSGTHTYPSFPGQQVSIFRFNGTTLSSDGLKWNAYPYAELWQGTLNEALTDSFTIHSDGEYLVFQTYEQKTLR